MDSITPWLDIYAQDHQDPTNKILHKIAVPLILFSVVGLFYALPAPEWFYGIRWSFFVIVLSFFYYRKFSFRLALVMYIVMLAQLSFAIWLNMAIGKAFLGVIAIIFVAGWILQFIGHAIEGRKPSFLADPRYLLIGPVWVLVDLLPHSKKMLKI